MVGISEFSPRLPQGVSIAKLVRDKAATPPDLGLFLKSLLCLQPFSNFPPILKACQR